MERSLLVGNGLNRCLEGGIAWGSLLEEIAKKYKVNYNNEILMPLEFERILNACMEKEAKENNNQEDLSSLYRTIKEQIADRMKKASLPEESIHKNIPYSSFNNILTTNYDLLLEKALEKALPHNKIINTIIGSNEKYIFHETAQIDEILFFHPHGIVNSPDSICLGYEHYMGVVEKLRNNYNGMISGKSKRDQGRIKKLEEGKIREKRICRILREIDAPLNEWGEKLYTSDVYIVGLGLTECESDLWWLLTHRASLYYSNYHSIRDVLKNKIIFYDVINDIKADDSEEEEYRSRQEQSQRNRHDLLRHTHVEVVTYSLNKYEGNYKSIYEEVFKQIT